MLLNARAAEYQRTRKTKPMTREECDALGEELDPTRELGLAMIDFDLETIRLLEERPDGKLSPKKLRKRQHEIWTRRCRERKEEFGNA